MTEAEEELGPKIDINEIRLYPEMDRKIVDFLKIRNTDIVSMYAAKLIDDLQNRIDLEIKDDEVVIAIKKSPRYRDMNDIDFVTHCLTGVKNNGWGYRIVKYSLSPEDNRVNENDRRVDNSDSKESCWDKDCKECSDNALCDEAILEGMSG